MFYILLNVLPTFLDASPSLFPTLDILFKQLIGHIFQLFIFYDNFSPRMNIFLQNSFLKPHI